MWRRSSDVYAPLHERTLTKRLMPNADFGLCMFEASDPAEDLVSRNVRFGLIGTPTFRSRRILARVYLAAARAAALLAAQCFLTPSLILLIAAGLSLLLAVDVPLFCETGVVGTPKYRPSRRRSFFALANALNVV
jgi:hypothetical protein